MPNLRISDDNSDVRVFDVCVLPFCLLHIAISLTNLFERSVSLDI